MSDREQVLADGLKDIAMGAEIMLQPGLSFTGATRRYIEEVRRVALATIEASKQVADREADLLEACNGLLGLLQLISMRPDVSADLREVLRTNHRVVKAQTLLGEQKSLAA
jgi:hypothetical protein